jgi:hypothetical protein
MKLKKVEIIYVDRINPNKRISTIVTVEDKGDKSPAIQRKDEKALQLRRNKNSICWITKH